jgi:LacI family transcriptional regulator
METKTQTKPARRGRSVVTIHDVAKHIGVSPMTVSRVINGEKYVREETREKVLSTLKELNYTPSNLARGLATLEGPKIAVLYSNPSSAYLNEFLLGVLIQSGKSGCHLNIESCAGPEEAALALEHMKNDGVEGVILPAPLSNSNRIAMALANLGLASVGVAAAQQPSGRTIISIDDYKAAYTMTMRLVELGHVRIGFIKGHPDNRASHFRAEGFMDAMNASGLDVDSDLVIQGYFNYQSGFNAAAALLGRADRPTAIFASNDDMAAGVLANAHSHGIDVPSQLSVVGFDDTTMATTVWPELTTVRQPTTEMSSSAVDLLLQQIQAAKDGTEPSPLWERRDFTIVERQSTAPAPKA